jgi:holliday junction DNA helicase RuvA
MIDFIKGKLCSMTPSTVVIDIGSIGYKIFIPVNLYGKLPNIGSEIILHTSLIIRENSQALYGFHSLSERELFEMLIGVTGIGPKLGLCIIGHMSAEQLQKSISNHDIATLSKIPGIGKKTAERLIIEVRDKIVSLLPPDPSDLIVNIPQNSKTQSIRDAISALINLGYNQVTAQKAVKKTLENRPNDVDLAALITESLNYVKT